MKKRICYLAVAMLHMSRRARFLSSPRAGLGMGPAAIVALAISLLMYGAASAVPPVGPASVPGKEYSHHFDHDFAGAADAEQSVFWDGTGAAFDTFDYTPMLCTFIGGTGPNRLPFDPTNCEGEVDAMAFDFDFLFQAVQADGVPLIFSTDADPSMYFEEAGATVGGVWAAPAVINAGVMLRDIDAIELWGPIDAGSDDAFNYSLETLGSLLGIPDPGGTAVWHVPGSTPGALGPVAVTLITDAEIAAAIAPLFPNFDVSDQQINLDGMMLSNVQVTLDDNNRVVDRRAEITFTLDPIVITHDDGTTTTILDGGEIFTWRFDSTVAPGPAAFLRHGGHIWDTAFGVMATYGTASENVNGLEGVSNIPEPASIALFAFGLVGLTCAGLSRRRRFKV